MALTTDNMAWHQEMQDSGWGNEATPPYYGTHAPPGKRLWVQPKLDREMQQTYQLYDMDDPPNGIDKREELKQLTLNLSLSLSDSMLTTKKIDELVPQAPPPFRVLATCVGA